MSETWTPYKLPEGNVQISFSGGRTSGYMLHQILEANNGLPDRARVVFANTGREMPATLDFVQECGERWNVPIVWVEYRAEQPWFEVVSHNSASRNGEPFEALILKKGALPGPRQRFCTEELKVAAAQRYLKSLGWKDWTNAVGIRGDEAHRARQTGRIARWHPMVDAGVSKHDVAAFWGRQPFDLRLPLVDGRTVGGNCDGCFLKSEATLASLARDHPERAAWWERMEEAIQRRKSGRVPSWSDRVRRSELREFVERQGDWIFSADGVLCQADSGECTG